MTWAKFDDRFPFHRKVRPLTDAAFRLHVSAICWSCEHLTDGRVLSDELALCSDVRKPTAAVAELVRRGMWHELPDGWAIHDFLLYNEPRQKVQDQREKEVKRKQAWRDKKDAERNMSADQSAGVPLSVPLSVPPGQDAGQGRPSGGPSGDSRSAHPDPTRPDPVKELKDTSASPPRPSAVDAPFDRFWQTYPRREGKEAARKAFTKGRRGTDPERIITGAARFRDDPNRQPEFTPHPATWLNAGRWDDDPLPSRNGSNVTEPVDPRKEWLRG